MTVNEAPRDKTDLAFLSAAAAAAEEILFTPERPAWQIIAFNGYLHYEDFAPSLRVWLEGPQR